MPKKFFHIINCPLSKRQRFLYEDYISRRKTKEQLASGSFLSMMGVLMQLRKVCNHPDLFETRPITTPFITKPMQLDLPRCAFIPDLHKVRSHEVNHCFNQDLTDEQLEENDWRKSLFFFPSSYQFVDTVNQDVLFLREQDSLLSVRIFE